MPKNVKFQQKNGPLKRPKKVPAALFIFSRRLQVKMRGKKKLKKPYKTTFFCRKKFLQKTSFCKTFFKKFFN